MELQTFTFFLLAFVALTDGVPRDLMDDSIDMTKPEHAKADLARARTRRAEGDWVAIQTVSGEAQLAALIANNWYNEQYGIFSIVESIGEAKRQFDGNLRYRVMLDLDVDGHYLFCYFTIEVPVPLAGEPTIWTDDDCSPTSPTFPTNDM